MIPQHFQLVNGYIIEQGLHFELLKQNESTLIFFICRQADTCKSPYINAVASVSGQ